MDTIFALGLGFSLLLGGICGILLGASYACWQKVKTTQKAGHTLSDALRHHALFLLVLFILWGAFLSYLRVQTALRPKNTLNSQNSALQQQLNHVDTQAIAPLPPAQGDKADQKNADYHQKNQQENQAAIKAFEKLGQ